MQHPYTLDALPAGDPRVVPRTPGLRDIERLFPAPVSVGRGRLAVEGGVSIVAGPGLGKTTLLAQLAEALDRERHLATAVVAFPDTAGMLGEDGFYRYLAALVVRIRQSLLASPRIVQTPFAAVRAVLAAEPAWDGGGSAGHLPGSAVMTPRGFESWMHALGAAAVHAPGLGLLFDDVDAVTPASWKSAFVAALRFTFQSCAGVTPIYALYRVYADESLPGSNYFRNVTRPLFLEPLSTAERQALLHLALPALTEESSRRIFSQVGGHPRLVHALLADLCAALPDGSDGDELTPADVDALLGGEAVERQHALVGALIARTPGLIEALRELTASQEPRAYRGLSRGLVASGLVDQDADGNAVVPARIAETL